MSPADSHNISAYEFTSPDGIRHSDNDDDGEKAAGSTLASLLERIVSFIPILLDPE